MAYDRRMNRAQAHMQRLHRLGWTMAAISRVSACSRSTLYRVEQGADVSLPTIKAILAVRGYPPGRPAKGATK
jgi:predicted transcriptional regulator